MKPNTAFPVNGLGRALFFASLASAAALPTAHAQSDQLNKYGCVACHAPDKKLVGPSFKDVAAKYRGTAGAEKELAARIRNGSSGVWGSVPMPPNSVPDADLGAMVKWILSQK